MPRRETLKTAAGGIYFQSQVKQIKKCRASSQIVKWRNLNLG